MINNQLFKNILLWLVIFVGIIALYQFVQTPRASIKDIQFSEFVGFIKNGEIHEVEFSEFEVRGSFLDENVTPNKFKAVGPATDDVIKLLEENNISFRFAQKRENTLSHMLLNWAPLLLLIVIMVLFMRQIQSGGTKAMSFGKSRARLLTEDQNKITFNDVAGIDEAKEEVKEIVDFLKNPKKFTDLG